MKKKKFLFIVCFLLISVFSTTLVACSKEDETPMIEPTSLQKYIDEIVEYIGDNYYMSQDSIFPEINLEYEYFHNTLKKLIKYEMTLKMNFSINHIKEENALFLEINKSIGDQPSHKILGLYGDNDDLYLSFYQDEWNKESKYHYQNTPIFDLLAKAIGNTFERESDFLQRISNIATESITGCTINKDKSQYIFNIEAGKMLYTMFYEPISAILDVLPQNMSNNFYSLFGSTDKQDFENTLQSISCELKVNIKDRIIQSYNVENVVVNGVLQDQLSMSFSQLLLNEKPISDLKKLIPNTDDSYENIKIGTISSTGKLNLKSASNTELVSYDVEFYASLDMLQLLNNNFDMQSLDEDNYFHLRISHKCNSDCGSYCSIERGNKYLKANGAILDFAFSPKDFGTKNMYLSVSLKSFIGSNSLPYIEDINNNLVDLVLLDLILADYQLLVIDTSASNNGAESNNKFVPNNIAKRFFEMLNYLNFDESGASLSVKDINSFFSALFDEKFDNEFIIINKILQNLQINKFEFTFDDLQYADVRNYDIAQKALFIISDEVEDGVVATKQYSKDSVTKIETPIKSWKFDQGNMTTDGKYIHNLYSADGELVYGANLPISPKELDSLVGGSIGYSYTNILGETTDLQGEQLVGNCKILQIENVDYSNTTSYQKIRLKLASPNNSFVASSLGKDAVENLLNNYFYVYLDIYVKLTPLSPVNYIQLERIDTLDGAEKTNYTIDKLLSYDEYKKIIGANLTYIYNDNSRKTIRIDGKTTMFDHIAGILRNEYAFNSLGEQKIVYYAAGNQIERAVFVEEPDIISLQNMANTNYLQINESELVSTFFSVKLNCTYNNEDGTKTTGSYNVNLKNFYIDGSPIYSSNDKFSILYNGVTQYIKFYREGEYVVTVDYLQEKLQFVLVVGSQNIGYSTYKLTCKTNITTPILANKSFSILYWLDNKTFGNKGLENQSIVLNVEKLNQNGKYEKALVSDYVLESLQLNGNDAQGIYHKLPAIIYTPYQIQYSMMITTEGYYKLTLKVGSVMHFLYIIVSA